MDLFAPDIQETIQKLGYNPGFKPMDLATAQAASRAATAQNEMRGSAGGSAVPGAAMRSLPGGSSAASSDGAPSFDPSVLNIAMMFAKMGKRKPAPAIIQAPSAEPSPVYQAPQIPSIQPGIFTDGGGYQ